MNRTVLLLSLLLFACGGQKIIIDSSRMPHPASNPNAAVTVLEYADLQCPACRAAHEKIVNPILEKYGSEIRYEFKHFPLRSIHRFALDAAESSECAADQEKFWDFVNIAFEKQSELNRDALTMWAKQIDLDVDVFEKCWKSRSKKDLVLRDYEEGRALGVAGTPTFFINGKRIESGFDTISKAIEEMIDSVRQRL